MGQGDVPCEGETKPGAAPAPRGERLEQVVTERFRHAGAVVLDIDQERVAFDENARHDARRVRAGFGDRRRVGIESVQNAGEKCRVYPHDVDCYLVHEEGVDLERSSRGFEHGGGRSRLALHGHAARQQQHVLDEMLAKLRMFADASQKARAVGGTARGGVRAHGDGGEDVAQLVRELGRSTPQCSELVFGRVGHRAPDGTPSGASRGCVCGVEAHPEPVVQAWRSVIMLAAFAAACGEAPREPREPTPGKAHFRVTSYNIKVERATDAETVEAVGSTDADVLCLQEVNAEWQAVLQTRYASAYPYMLFAAKENAGGMGWLSRFPLTDRGVVQPPAGIHPGWVVEVQLATFTLQLVGVHLRSLFNGEASPPANFLEVGDLHRSEIEMFFQRTNATLPTVVLGDFNEGMEGAAVRWLASRGYQNALHTFHPGQYTWSGPSVGQTYDLAIDHIMAGSAFELLDARTWRLGNSDHLPLTAHLELR